MGFVNKTSGGTYRAYFRDPSGKQRSKTFRLKKDAQGFLNELESAKSRGVYVSPHAGRVLFGVHAGEWMDARSLAVTTAAKDRAVMRTHVLPRWAEIPLGKIDHMGLQAWATELGRTRSHDTTALALRLASAVLRSAVRNRLIPFNPAEDVQLPRAQRRATDERIISRAGLREQLLPEVPERSRAVVALAAAAGLRWGEVAGLRTDALDLDANRVHVVRTVIEVNGNTSFKPFPKSTAGRRTIPLPSWVLPYVRDHMRFWPTPTTAPVFANEVGAPLRRSLFRSRVWRPALVRAGLLGEVLDTGEGTYLGRWTDGDEQLHEAAFGTRSRAVREVARRQAGGLRFHDLRHSYATWLVDDGVPPNMVQRVLGHERATTTLDLYTRRTDNADRILRALGDEEDDDGNDESPPTAPVPVR